jgi:hypothetical protein
VSNNLLSSNYKDNLGEWQQHSICFHRTSWDRKKDLKYPRVFIAKHFYYFGERAVEIPFEFRGLIYKRQGCKSNHNPDTIKDFLYWLQTSFKPGILGEPREKGKSSGDSIELML